MVYRLVLASLIFICGASVQAQSLLKSAEPAYVQAVASRFAKWTFENFAENKKSKEALRDLANKEIANMDSWYFEIAPGFQIERVQFGSHWQAGQQRDSYFLVFPMNPSLVWTALGKIQAVPSDLETDFVGFGFSYQSPEIYIFNKAVHKAKPNLCKTILNGAGKAAPTRCLSEVSEPSTGKVAFSPLVKKWRVWSGDASDALQYELHFDKFNLRFLDGAAIEMSRKINNEFLLNNLRIHFRAIDDYELLYP